MINAVLFDLDDTLLNRSQSLKAFVTNQYDRYILFLNHIDKQTFINRFIELDAKGYVWKDVVYQRLILEFAITNITYEEFLQDYMNQFHKHCIPFENLYSVLDELKEAGMKLCLISNGLSKFQRDNIQALDIQHYFDMIIISEEEGIKKPNHSIFHTALKKLQLLPHECIFVGDHPENDVKASQDVGMIGIWMKSQQQEIHFFEAHYTIRDLGKIPSIVKKCNVVSPR